MPSFNSIGKSIAAKSKFGEKKLCVITGTSSGLGKQTARHLIKTGMYHVVCAVRDVDKMLAVAEDEGFDSNSFTVMECELGSFSSVRKFAAQLEEFRSDKPIDRVVCNAAVYQPSLSYAKFSDDGIEQQLQINYLSHFLLINLLVRVTFDFKAEMSIAD